MMKRTKFPLKTSPQPLPLNLIRSLAWTFYKTTKVSWDELFSEACLAYCESITKWEPNKGASQTTWAYIAMKNALINFCKREHLHQNPKGLEDWCEVSYEPLYEFFEEEETKWQSPDVESIVLLARQNPARYYKYATKQFGNLWKDLVNKEGWTWKRVWQGMRDLRHEVVGMPASFSRDAN